MNLATYTLLGALSGAVLMGLGIGAALVLDTQPALVEHCGTQLPPMPQPAPRIERSRI